jgi:Integrase core domain
MDLSYPKRLLLYSLLQQHPAWKQAQLAKATGMSESWVKEWRHRLRPSLDAPFEQVYLVLQGQFCARKTPPAHLSFDEIFQIASFLLRFGSCLGIEMDVCDPQYPEQNASVERFHRTLKQECLKIERPTTLGETQEVLNTFEAFYNHERPHQGRALVDRPPADKLAEAPPLPAVPTTVDPLAWLRYEPQQVFRRRVDAAGRIKLDLKRYDVGKALHGQTITVHLNAREAKLVLLDEGRIIKEIAVPSWSKDPVPFAVYVQQMQEPARAEHRLRSLQERQQRVRALSST